MYVRSRRAGERVMETLRRLYARLRLRVNEAQSAVARPWNRKFLGYSLWLKGDLEGLSTSGVNNVLTAAREHTVRRREGRSS